MDVLFKTAMEYLTRVLRQPLNREEHAYAMGLIHILDSLEKINDVVERDFKYRIESKLSQGIHFSSFGKEELLVLVGRLIRVMRMTHKALVQNNSCLAEETIGEHPRIIALIREYRQNHIHRLSEGVRETEETSNLHLELLNSLQQLSEMVREIDLTIFEELSKGIRCLDVAKIHDQKEPDSEVNHSTYTPL
jgi:phosphate:Na+ symporter